MGNSSEKQVSEPLPDDEELKRREEERKAARKARGNNGAKHDMHHELETVEHDVYPDNPDFDLRKARPLSDVQRISVRYEFIPMRFIKHVYRIHAYTQDEQVMEGRTPPSAFLNSSYDASFVAGLLELSYLQSMPVERIVSYLPSTDSTSTNPRRTSSSHRLPGLWRTCISPYAPRSSRTTTSDVTRHITGYSYRKGMLPARGRRRATCG